MNGNKIGFQTITWGEELADLDTALRDITELGFGHFEVLNTSTLVTDYERRTLQLGPVSPPRAVTDTQYATWLTALVDGSRKHGLRLVSIYTDAEYLNTGLWELERAGFVATMAILRGLDAEYLVCGGGPPSAGADHSADEYRRMGAALEEIGRLCAELGLQLCYHPHIDTFVETAEELDRLAEVTDPELVGLCIDPAHFVLTGGDPVGLVERHIDRVKYCHLKDVERGDVNGLQGRQRYEAFVELGEGQVDLKGMVEVLRRHDFAGPLVVELDYSRRTPRESAEISKRYLVETLDLLPGNHAAVRS
jgi:inosose dehydratase